MESMKEGSVSHRGRGIKCVIRAYGATHVDTWPICQLWLSGNTVSKMYGEGRRGGVSVSHTPLVSAYAALGARLLSTTPTAFWIDLSAVTTAELGGVGSFSIVLTTVFASCVKAPSLV